MELSLHNTFESHPESIVFRVVGVWGATIAVQRVGILSASDHRKGGAAISALFHALAE